MEHPRTIEELKSWAEYTNYPLEQMRTFIGEDYQGAQAYGIFYDNWTGKYVVYKNKSDGSRAVRYEGKDEAQAVGELFAKMNQRLEEREKFYSGGADVREVPVLTPREIRQVMTRELPAQMRRHSGFRIFTFVTGFFMVSSILFVIGGSLLVHYFSGKPHDNRQGYYYYDDTYYYRQGSDFYYYDLYNDNWYYADDLDDEFYGNYRDYYQADNFYAGDVTPFYESDFYNPAYYDDYDSDYDSDYDYGYDYDYDYDYDSDWDSGWDDWDSDW